jgi:hypothetical protein
MVRARGTGKEFAWFMETVHRVAQVARGQNYNRRGRRSVEDKARSGRVVIYACS